MSSALTATAIAGVAVAALSAAMLVAPTGQAAQADTRDWGSTGLIDTPSAVTVRWDNLDNPASDVVSRSAEQVLPHTANKTYADIDPVIRDEYENHYGTNNGLGGLAVTISQTTGLINQAVQVTVAGAKGGRDGFVPGSSLQLMQCWGAMGADGVPDPNASQPDPATCQVGAGGSDQTSVGDPATTRTLHGDPLVADGDWAQFGADTFNLPAPFQSITGGVYRGHEFQDNDEATENPYFNHTTTNELTNLYVQADGSARTLFELQTGQESEALGCGKRDGKPTVAACWIVVVPRPESSSPASGNSLRISAVAPSVWAQRLQVKLAFRDIADRCPGSASRTLVSGSELLTSAMASWIPGACSAKKLAVGYTTLGDPQARTQLAVGGGLAFTTQPLSGGGGIAASAASDSGDGEGVLYAPVALAAPVVAFTIDLPAGQGRDLRLDPRLVAKLLTQSYRDGMDDTAGTEMKTNAPWELAVTRSLFADPEFAALNPELTSVANNLSAGDLVVENVTSDAGTQVWRWLTSDPDASAFLNGCPDDNGMVINPFFSTRTYVGCSPQRTVLEKAWKTKVDNTKLPETFTHEAASYPPTTVPFPQPGWYARSPQPAGDNLNYPARTWNDIHSRVASLAAAGRTTFLGQYPSNSELCLSSADPTCIPKPGVWKAGGRQNPGSRLVLSITDAATAARFQLPTAQLCDDRGTHCVGADRDSLAAAAAAFIPTSTDGVSQPATRTVNADGAYPLTMPVYAAVSMSDLTEHDAKSYSTLLRYLATSGQKSGLEIGQLPAGYAPLPAAMVTQTTGVAATLAAYQQPVGEESTVIDDSTPTTVFVPQTIVPPTLDSPAVAPTTPPAIALEPTAKTGPTTVGFPQFGLVFGLGAAVFAGVLAPIFGRRRKKLEL